MAVFRNLSITTSWDFMHGSIWCNCLHIPDRGSSSIIKICYLMQKELTPLTQVFSFFSPQLWLQQFTKLDVFLLSLTIIKTALVHFIFVPTFIACSFLHAKRSCDSYFQCTSKVFICIQLHIFKASFWNNNISP